MEVGRVRELQNERRSGKETEKDARPFLAGKVVQAGRELLQSPASSEPPTLF